MHEFLANACFPSPTPPAMPDPLAAVRRSFGEGDSVRPPLPAAPRPGRPRTGRSRRRRLAVAAA